MVSKADGEVVLIPTNELEAIVKIELPEEEATLKIVFKPLP